jgi:hypothetical protein
LRVDVRAAPLLFNMRSKLRLPLVYNTGGYDPVERPAVGHVDGFGPVIAGRRAVHLRRRSKQRVDGRTKLVFSKGFAATSGATHDTMSLLGIATCNGSSTQNSPPSHDAAATRVPMRSAAFA